MRVPRGTGGRLSDHFSFWELCQNWRGGEIEKRNFEIAEDYRDSLERLAVEILEPARVVSGPIRVSSGFRWSELEPGTGRWRGLDVAIRTANQRRRYQPRSQHTRGEAADLIPLKIEVDQLFEWIRRSGIRFGQLIYEVSRRSEWIHVSLPAWNWTRERWIEGEVYRATVHPSGRVRYRRVK